MTRILDMLSGRHRPDVEALSAHLDNALNAKREAMLVAHLETCDRCRVRLAQLRDARSALRELPAVEAPRSFRLREAQVREATRAASRGMRTGVFLPALGAAALFMLVALVGVDLLSTNGDNASDSSVRSAAEADTTQDSLEMAQPMMDEFAGARAGFDAAPTEIAAASGEAAAAAPEAIDAPPPESTGVLASAPDAAKNSDRAATTQPPAPGAARNTAPTGQPDTDNAAATDTAAGDDGDIGALRLAQIIAAAVTAIVGGATIIMWRRKAT